MTTYLRALRHRDFRNMFLGQSASAVGDQVAFIAIALYVTMRTGSSTDLGLVLAAGAIPLVGLILFGGVWADRLPRHRIMIVADFCRAALHGGLAVLILAGGASVAELVAIEAVFGAARAFFQPAYTGLLPQTIPEEEIQDARALSEVTNNLAILVGPALGTVLTLTLGAGEALALDCATFLASALLLLRVTPRSRGEAPPAEPVLRELRAGWREVRSRPWVWVTILCFTGIVLCVYSQWNALAPVIARNHYGSAGVFGVLETVTGAGALGGALLGVRWRPKHPMRVALLLVSVWPLQNIVFALGHTVALVLPFAFATGLGFSLFAIMWETSLARHIPPHALSRVSAYDWMGSLALLPVGFLIAGPVAGVVGARHVLAGGSVIGLALIGVALLPRSTRRLDAGPGAPAQEEAVLPPEAAPQPSISRAMSA